VGLMDVVALLYSSSNSTLPRSSDFCKLEFTKTKAPKTTRKNSF
jgi:hypothetical protein